MSQRAEHELHFISNGVRHEPPASPGLDLAASLGLLQQAVFELHNPQTYIRPLDREISAYKQGQLPLGEMTPAYAHAMVWSELKARGKTVKTFSDEMALAQAWKEKLTELCLAYGLPENHISINTDGPVIHLHPVERSGVTPGQNGYPLNFQTLDQLGYPARVGRGYEAILPTHVQGSGYNTPAHPEMDSSLHAVDAIPQVFIGKYVRVGGAFNVQGQSVLRIDDNAWIGQHAYFITQEHPADRPAQLARSRSETSFPGVHVGAWSWVAKEAKVLYRTAYIGEGAVVASQAKVNSWVGDHSLVTSEGHQIFYPAKSFVLNTLGIRDTHEVLALDWAKVEALWMSEYNRWAQQEHTADQEVTEAISALRDNQRAGRVLFIGSENSANILHAANPRISPNQLRRIDVMTVKQQEQAYVMQALNGMRVRNTRFRNVDDLGYIPLGEYYQEPLYDLVVIETSAAACIDGGLEMQQIVAEAQRLVKPTGQIIGTLQGLNQFEADITLPGYVDAYRVAQENADRLAIHVQNIVK